MEVGVLNAAVAELRGGVDVRRHRCDVARWPSLYSTLHRKL